MRTKSIFCECCDKLLPYEIGSVSWLSVEKDICAGCEGRNAARGIIGTKMRKILEEQASKRMISP
jgi:hypothetical protein